jgi:hypothetical protein
MEKVASKQGLRIEDCHRDVRMAFAFLSLAAITCRSHRESACQARMSAPGVRPSHTTKIYGK